MSPNFNPTTLEDYKTEGRATKPLQQRAAENNQAWGTTEHLPKDLCKTGIIYAQEDWICHQM